MAWQEDMRHRKKLAVGHIVLARYPWALRRSQTWVQRRPMTASVQTSRLIRNWTGLERANVHAVQLRAAAALLHDVLTLAVQKQAVVAAAASGPP
jgi:hypothetical protein